MKEADLEKLSKIELYEVNLCWRPEPIYRVRQRNLLTGEKNPNIGWNSSILESEILGRPFNIIDSEYGLVSKVMHENMQIEKLYEMLEQALCLEEVLKTKGELTIGLITGSYLFSHAGIIYSEPKNQAPSKIHIATPAEFIRIIETKHDDRL